jgi:hypothetical protein
VSGVFPFHSILSLMSKQHARQPCNNDCDSCETDLYRCGIFFLESRLKLATRFGVKMEMSATRYSKMALRVALACSLLTSVGSLS